MASKKKIDKQIEQFERGDFEFFTKEAQRIEGVRIYDAGKLENAVANSTGSYSLDYDLSVPIPEGRIVEVAGNESSGKSTLCLEIIGQALQNGKHALYLNLERALDRTLLLSIRTLRPFLTKDGDSQGGQFKIVETVTGEQALNVARLFCTQFSKSVVVIDSVDSCIPEAILSGDIGERNMGGHARLMSDAMRKLVNVVGDNGVALVFINQFRKNIGGYGDPNVTTGGEALKYYASQKITLLKPSTKEFIKNGDAKLGHVVRYKITKNKLAPQGVEGSFPLLYYNGIFREQELITLGLKFGIIEVGGKGGRQTLLPILDENGEPTGEVEGYSRLNAGRRLFIDPVQTKYLKDKLLAILNKDAAQAADKFTNEVSDD